MIGERLAAIRGDNDETQAELAEKLSVSVYTVRSWERNASAPSNEILVQICKMYGVSADYLLGLADYDPDYTRRLHQAKFTESERRELKKIRTISAVETQTLKPPVSHDTDGCCFPIRFC